ncbi:MAG: tetratricopeptide repeat protein [Steroidobacteraceae bacterium]
MRAEPHTCRLAIAAIALVAPLAAIAHEGTCKNSTSQSESVLAASKALERDARDLQARLQVADALMADNCVDDAVHLLEEGEAIHGRNAQLQSQLREARSMMREQTYFEGLNRAEEAAKLSHNLLRCTRLGDIEACDQALARQPGDPQIQLAKADALLQAKRPGEALPAYRRAHELNPGDAAIEQKIATTQTQRRAFLDTCQNGTGQSALQACQAALWPGNDDEFAIRKRSGILLQASNQPAAALDSYIAANMLQQGDRSVALAIIALSTNTGRKDALTLAARGSALLTVGRALDALAPLKQALALSPDLPEAKTQLVEAERLAKAEARKLAANATAKPAATIVAEAPSRRRYSNTAPINNSN